MILRCGCAELSCVLQSKDFTTFRRALPPDAHVVIAKNTLMGKAAGA